MASARSSNPRTVAQLIERLDELSRLFATMPWFRKTQPPVVSDASDVLSRVHTECFFCRRSLDMENSDVTDVYSDDGVFKVHRRCAGAAQDWLDEEFEAKERREEEEARTKSCAQSSNNRKRDDLQRIGTEQRIDDAIPVP